MEEDFRGSIREGKRRLLPVSSSEDFWDHAEWLLLLVAACYLGNLRQTASPL